MSNAELFPLILTYDEAAKLLSVSYRTIQRMVASRELERVKIRGCFRVSSRSVLYVGRLMKGDAPATGKRLASQDRLWRQYGKPGVVGRVQVMSGFRKSPSNTRTSR